MKVIVFTIIMCMITNIALANSLHDLFTMIPYDRQLHFTWSFVLAVTIGILTNNPIIGLALVVSLGLAKEYLIDSKPDLTDLAYGIVGALLGSIIAGK